MKISILLRKPPYGTYDASEAIRHALGGIIEEIKVNLILLDGGVNAVRKNQIIVNNNYSTIEDAIKDCISMEVKVYADKASVRVENIDNDNLIDGVVIVESSEIAELIIESDIVMIF